MSDPLPFLGGEHGGGGGVEDRDWFLGSHICQVSIKLLGS